MVQSKFRYEIITTQGGGQILPTFDLLNVNDPDFVITETIEKGKFYYIKKVKSKLNLIGSDFDFFYSKYRLCYKYYVRIYKECTDGEKFILQCYFNDVDLEVDIDKCSMEVELTVDSPYNCIKKKGGTKFDIFGGAQPLNTLLDISPTIYRSADWLVAILFINGQMQCCDEFGCYVSVKSDFFNWVEDGGGGTTLVTDQAFTNYVNPLQPNYYLRIAQKSDIKNPTATNPATKLMMSFNDVEDIMKEIFNCFFIIEYIGSFPYIRWEHYSWFVKNMNYDATTVTNFPFNEYKNKVKLDNTDFPTSELWKFMEANGIDFVGTTLTYSNDCTSGEQKDRGIELLTTDTEFIRLDPNSISNEGFVLIDCYEVIVNSLWSVYTANGAITTALVRNVRLSNANIQYDLHRYGRPLLSGTMNNIFQTFLSTEPNIIQENIITQLCCTDDFEKWKSSVRTELGFGKIDEAEINYTKEQIKFKLRHDSIG